MRRQLNGPKEVAAGLIYISVGVTAFVMSHNYEIGTLLSMGPGYFPALVGVLLICLGTGSIVLGIRRKIPDPIPTYKLEPLFLVMVGIASFAFFIERSGLVIAAGSLVFFSCFRRIMTNPFEVILTYLALTGFSVVVFVYWFGMVIPIF